LRLRGVLWGHEPLPVGVGPKAILFALSAGHPYHRREYLTSYVSLRRIVLDQNRISHPPLFKRAYRKRAIIRPLWRLQSLEVWNSTVRESYALELIGCA
jgi:hypothetical protein